MSTTKIEWADRTWNPVRGCAVVSPGCVNCYAMKQAHRFSGPGKPYEGLTKLTAAGPQWTGVVRTVPNAIQKPLWWSTPARVFVNSMSDLFHEDVPDAFIDEVYDVMARTPHLTFIVLTKRSARMRRFYSALEATPEVPPYDRAFLRPPQPNVHLYVSVENQQQADLRIDDLLRTPARVRGVSLEPMLGPVNLSPWLRPVAAPGRCIDIDGSWWHAPGSCPSCRPRLDHVIVGGESGAGARPCDVAWVLDVVRQCRAAGVPVFVKQLGGVPVVGELRIVGDLAWPAGTRSVDDPHFPGVLRVRLADLKGGDPAEWPDDLRVREFPRAVAK